MTDPTPIIEAAIAAAAPQALDGGDRFFTVAAPAGAQVKVIDLEAEADKLTDYPRRKTGVYRVHDADSFVAYLAKHGVADSEVWADVVAAKVTGVLNAHEQADGLAKFEDHRVEYTVLLTEAWKRWTTFDGKLLDQETFAELIEERSLDVVTPSGADMLEIAQTMKATTSTHMESSIRLSTGLRQFTYKTTIDGQAGKAGQMEIPETFALALRPFEGADAFKVTARLRYRLNGGELRIGYKLERPEDVIREAFTSVVAKVQVGVTELDLLNMPILLGSR